MTHASDEIKKRILVVDDEETLCEALCFNLEAEGYATGSAYSAEQALSMDLSAYDLVVLDVMMGEISGVQLARIMKSNPATSHVPILFCSARDSEDDVISGLDIGADDYVTKPYSLRELLARVRSVLRRYAAYRLSEPHGHDRLIYKGLSLSIPDKTCSVDGETVKLPRKEFEILRKLMADPGHIFSREELLRDIWPGETVVLDRVVDVNITRIRQKIGAYGKNIVTRSGYGYGFFE
jgi:two-component system phosphate regulon response regulator PhoB